MLLNKRMAKAFCLVEEDFAILDENDLNGEVQKCQAMFYKPHSVTLKS
jgi:hypothetical protein